MFASTGIKLENQTILNLSLFVLLNPFNNMGMSFLLSENPVVLK